VCGETAGKHTSYGGKVCPSCRAFFRRSVQTRYFAIFACDKQGSILQNSISAENFTCTYMYLNFRPQISENFHPKKSCGFSGILNPNKYP
jgi:hypothetical protein